MKKEFEVKVVVTVRVVDEASTSAKYYAQSEIFDNLNVCFDDNDSIHLFSTEVIGCQEIEEEEEDE